MHDRQAAHRRIPGLQIRASSASRCSTSRRWSGSASPSRVRIVDRRAIREPAAQLRLRHRSSIVGRSRCRPATSSASSGARRRPTRPVRATCRHQESGGRHADRAGDLRQGPGRTGRGDPSARPRAAVEPLRRAAMDLSANRAPRAGTASAMPSRLPKYGRSGFPDHLVVRRRKGGADRKALLRNATAHGAAFHAGMSWLSASAAPLSVPRRSRSAAARPKRRPRPTASRPSATSNIRPTFTHFDYVNPTRRRAARSR